MTSGQELVANVIETKKIDTDRIRAELHQLLDGTRKLRAPQPAASSAIKDTAALRIIRRAAQPTALESALGKLADMRLEAGLPVATPTAAPAVPAALSPLQSALSKLSSAYNSGISVAPLPRQGPAAGALINIPRYDLTQIVRRTGDQESSEAALESALKKLSAAYTPGIRQFGTELKQIPRIDVRQRYAAFTGREQDALRSALLKLGAVVSAALEERIRQFRDQWTEEDASAPSEIEVSEAFLDQRAAQSLEEAQACEAPLTLPGGSQMSIASAFQFLRELQEERQAKIEERKARRRAAVGHLTPGTPEVADNSYWAEVEAAIRADSAAAKAKREQEEAERIRAEEKARAEAKRLEDAAAKARLAQPVVNEFFEDPVKLRKRKAAQVAKQKMRETLIKLSSGAIASENEPQADHRPVLTLFNEAGTDAVHAAQANALFRTSLNVPSARSHELEITAETLFKSPAKQPDEVTAPAAVQSPDDLFSWSQPSAVADGNAEVNSVSEVVAVLSQEGVLRHYFVMGRAARAAMMQQWAWDGATGVDDHPSLCLCDLASDEQAALVAALSKHGTVKVRIRNAFVTVLEFNSMRIEVVHFAPRFTSLPEPRLSTLNDFFRYSPYLRQDLVECRTAVGGTIFMTPSPERHLLYLCVQAGLQSRAGDVSLMLINSMDAYATEVWNNRRVGFSRALKELEAAVNRPRRLLRTAVSVFPGALRKLL